MTDSRSFRGNSGTLRDGFFVDALAASTKYLRAAGFFSSSVFRASPSGFRSLFAQGSEWLVCSPVFSQGDVRALQAGLYEGEKFWGRDAPEIDSRDWATELLSWTVANGKLSVQVAIHADPNASSLYHEKFGILIGRERKSAFMGSANETLSGLVVNYERITTSAHRPSEAVELEDEFWRLWSNQTPGLRVMPLHEAFSEGHVEVADQRDPELSRARRRMKPTETPRETLHRPIGIELRDYQEQAIDSWLGAGGRGVLALATGSGKTITALSLVLALFEQVGPPLVVVVVVPYLHLADQWISEAQAFGLKPIRCAEGRARWQAEASNRVWLANCGKLRVVSLVVTNSTFATPAFRELLDSLECRTVLIGDEVHNLGAGRLKAALPERITLRLGLSATPERWMDEEGTAAISDYFGPVVSSFSISDGIRRDPPVLSPYMYHPVLVPLTEREAEEYLDISRALARFISDPKTTELSEQALALLLKRARLVGAAQNKLPALRRTLEPYKETAFNLIYCGDGSSELESVGITELDSPTIMRQIDAVTMLAGTDLRMGVAQYVATTSSQQRTELKKDFENRRIQALIAIRCLDEGVDIPQVRRAFILASATNPRQFVQRRGRLLRLADGKERAEIFDFVVVPPAEVMRGDPAFSTVRGLLEREMARVIEFAADALNGPQARALLRPTLESFDLLHL